jgi:hypothetical protein
LTLAWALAQAALQLAALASTAVITMHQAIMMLVIMVKIAELGWCAAKYGTVGIHAASGFGSVLKFAAIINR